jgi:hypothetical protein
MSPVHAICTTNLMFLGFIVLIILPNDVIEWLTLLRIREVPGSNLGPATGYDNSGFSWFFSVPPGEYQKNTLN